MKIGTQQEAVLKLFKKGRWVTPIIAFEYTGTMRLAAVVVNLKKQNFKFDKKQIKFKTRFGTSGFCVAYKLIK